MAKFYTFEEWIAAHPVLEKQLDECECPMCIMKDGDGCETLGEMKEEYEYKVAEEQRLYQLAMKVAS